MPQLSGRALPRGCCRCCLFFFFFHNERCFVVYFSFFSFTHPLLTIALELLYILVFFFLTGAKTVAGRLRKSYTRSSAPGSVLHSFRCFFSTFVFRFFFFTSSVSWLIWVSVLGFCFSYFNFRGVLFFLSFLLRASQLNQRAYTLPPSFSTVLLLLLFYYYY